MSVLGGGGGMGGEKTHTETQSAETGDITLGGDFVVGSGSTGSASAANVPEWVWAGAIGLAALTVIILLKR